MTTWLHRNTPAQVPARTPALQPQALPVAERREAVVGIETAAMCIETGIDTDTAIDADIDADGAGAPTTPTDDRTRHLDAAQALAAAGGSVAAFEALYRRHVGRVRGVIARLVGHHGQRADDLTQDAFVRAWQALPAWRGDSALGTWLHRIAVNVALMELRACRSRPDTAGDPLADDDSPIAARTHDSAGDTTALGMDLARAVASLPDRARAVLVLFDVEGWTHDDIAQALGIAVGSSKAQLHRARQLLRTRLDAHA